jgi:hypothetical protein
MTDLIYLYNLGHFHCPENYNSGNVLSHVEVGKVDIDHPAAVAAIKSYQSWFEPTLSQYTQIYHKRPAILDGEAAVATEDLLKLTRCNFPDIITPEYMTEFGWPAMTPDQANWPEACRNEITTSYDMKLDGLTDQQLAQLWVENHWEEKLELKRVFQKSSYPNTRFYAFKYSFGGSILADHYLATNNCNTRLRGRYDNRSWNEKLFVATKEHEHGHGLGFEHISESRGQATMNPILNNATQSRRGAPTKLDLDLAMARGYKLRSSPPPPPTEVLGRIVLPRDLKKDQVIVLTSSSNGNDNGDNKWF